MWNVYFVNRQKRRKLIGKRMSSPDAVTKAITDFLDSHRYRASYQRYTPKGNITYIDVGSHTEHFEVEEINND